jgi:hypothetical protein
MFFFVLHITSAFSVDKGLRRRAENIKSSLIVLKVWQVKERDSSLVKSKAVPFDTTKANISEDLRQHVDRSYKLEILQ